MGLNRKEIMELATQVSSLANNIRITLSRRFFVDETCEEMEKSETNFYKQIEQFQELQLQLTTAVLSYRPENETKK